MEWPRSGPKTNICKKIGLKLPPHHNLISRIYKFNTEVSIEIFGAIDSPFHVNHSFRKPKLFKF